MQLKLFHRGRGLAVRIGIASVAGASCNVGLPAHASPIYGGPSYDSTTLTGYSNPALPLSPGSTAGNGAAVGNASSYIAGINVGPRAVRWDASSNSVIELGNLGTSSSGMTATGANAINPAGTADGYAEKYTAGSHRGHLAVRWDASGTAVELENLSADDSSAISEAFAINAGGTSVGYAAVFVAGKFARYSGIRWDGSGTATELGNIGTGSRGITFSQAFAVNDAGTAVGFAEKYVAGMDRGDRAVRWDASGTTATELDGLGLSVYGYSSSRAYAVNAAGTAVGYALKFIDGTSAGSEAAVRWEATGTAATELDNLSTDDDGYGNSRANAVNAAGTAVGISRKFIGKTDLGVRAVRWDAAGSAITELNNLGTDSNGYAVGRANAINDGGITVGYAQQYLDGSYIDSRAVAWGPDGVAIDLNTFLSLEDALLWDLFEARSISNTNWVTGLATYDPDGMGSQPSYTRAFLIQVPEPTSLTMLLACATWLARRRR